MQQSKAEDKSNWKSLGKVKEKLTTPGRVVRAEAALGNQRHAASQSWQWPDLAISSRRVHGELFVYEKRFEPEIFRRPGIAEHLVGDILE